MRKTLIRVLTTILVSALVVGATETATAAGPLVRLTFSGTGTQTGVLGTVKFSGCVQYDSSLTKTSASYFDFTGSALNHEVCYWTSGGLSGNAIQPHCDPYWIHTSANSGKTFQLQGTTGTTPNTVTVTVTIPAATGVTFNPAKLPTCPLSGPGPFSTNSGLFTLTNASGTSVIFSGTIQSVVCSQPAVGSDCSCAQMDTTAPPILVATYAPMDSYPVYACPPRQSCCVTRLFSRLFHRDRCW
jgi:hypothetical protein